ncbi:MAG TPA: YdeI/OmpD-associated family protein, partial [Cyclobacteriaceae bacterium]|nr:YdeI/OmpD-associated family protein [Cyclobacteriaceae bacterium]
KPAGKAMIDLARKTGTWEALISVQEGIVPDDLQKQFDKSKIAFRNFSAFPPSSKRIILEWIMNAKKPETRKQRIIQTVELAKKNIRANHYRQ